MVALIDAFLIWSEHSPHVLSLPEVTRVEWWLRYLAYVVIWSLAFGSSHVVAATIIIALVDLKRLERLDELLRVRHRWAVLVWGYKGPSNWGLFDWGSNNLGAIRWSSSYLGNKMVFLLRIRVLQIVVVHGKPLDHRFVLGLLDIFKIWKASSTRCLSFLFLCISLLCSA